MTKHKSASETSGHTAAHRRTVTRLTWGILAVVAVVVLGWVLSDPRAFSGVREHFAMRRAERALDERDVAALAALTESASDKVRIKALTYLGEVGDPAALPCIEKRLADPMQNVRIAACKVLGQFGPAAREAIPALQRVINDPTASDADRAYAKEALEKIQAVPPAPTWQTPP